MITLINFFKQDRIVTIRILDSLFIYPDKTHVVHRHERNNEIADIIVDIYNKPLYRITLKNL